MGVEREILGVKEQPLKVENKSVGLLTFIAIGIP
jgi:hypothetical protein